MPTKKPAPSRRTATARAASARPARNRDASRERLLQAAIKEFSAKGYSGARVDAICRSSRSNPRMLYHYFGDKDGLYVAVLDHVLGELRREELKLEVDHVGPLEGMMQLFDFVHGHFGRHPELINLLSGENLLRARFLARSVKTPIVSSPLIELIDRLLERGAREGVFRSGIDPLQLYVMLVALSYYHRSNAFTLSAIFRADLSSPSWQATYKRYAEHMITRFLVRS